PPQDRQSHRQSRPGLLQLRRHPQNPRRRGQSGSAEGVGFAEGLQRREAAGVKAGKKVCEVDAVGCAPAHYLKIDLNRWSCMSKHWRCAVLGTGLVGDWHVKVTSRLPNTTLV